MSFIFRKKNDRTSTSEIPDTIRSWEKDKGGWRYDENQESWYLPWDELLEYEQKNLSTKEDAEFYEWFKDFRKERKIGRSNYGSYSRSATPVTTWDDDDDWVGGSDWYKKNKGSGKSLSSWWASDVHWGFKGSDASTTKLALALKAIRTVIRAVDDNVPPMSVHWDDGQDGASYTDFTGKKIVVNPKPVTDTTTSDGDAIDVTTGFALHEGSHSQYSREPYEALTKPTEVSPLQIGALLLNIAEDVRIESETMRVYPGFRGYFDKAIDWTWDRTKGKLPPEYGPDLWSKVNSVIAIARYPDSHMEMKHPSFAPEIIWWTAWRDEYLSGKYGARETIERGLEHLREKTEEEKKKDPGPGDGQAGKEMDELAKNEAAMKAAGAALKAIIDKLLKEGLDKLLIKACVNTTEKGDEIASDATEEVERLVGEDLMEDKVHIKTPRGQACPPLYIRRPKEDADSRRSYIGKPSGVLQRLKAALVFRQELPRYHNRLLKTGGLDEEELWRWKDRDYRVFQEEVIAARPKVQMSLLVDMSGSMMGTKLRTAQELTQLFIWALREMDGVDTKVFGHTGDLEETTCEIYRLWEKGEPMTRLGLITSMPHANNYDGYAIEWCVREVMNRGDVDEQRVLIVMSDGYPAGTGYGGMDAQLHMRSVVDWAAKQGVDVIQIAIDPSMRPADQGRMFKHWIPFESNELLPRQLTKLLDKLTSAN